MAKSGKLSILRELWDFMKVRKKWWLGPIVIVLLLLGLLIVLTQGSALAPFIYTLFCRPSGDCSGDLSQVAIFVVPSVGCKDGGFK